MLSSPTTLETLDYAEEYLTKKASPPKENSGLTWEKILAEEPFEGQHWEGVYGLPPGSTVEGWEVKSGESTPSLSPIEDSDDPDDTFSSSDFVDYNERGAADYGSEDPSSAGITSHQMYTHREDMENLRARQYWRSDWYTDANVHRPFNIGDASTLGMCAPFYFSQNQAVSEMTSPISTT